MNEESLSLVWDALRARKLLGAAPPVRLDGGNADRLAGSEKWTFRIELPDGQPAKIAVGKHLGPSNHRAEAWAVAYPAFAARPLFDFSVGTWEVHGETFFAGESLRAAIIDASIPAAVIHLVLTQISAALSAAAMPSTSEARDAEWLDRSDALLRLPLWSATDRTYLGARLLPALGRRIAQFPPQKQWIHGDLTDHNILLNAAGEVRVIDAEFAMQTHFAPLERAHFHALSESWREQPALFASAWSRPGPEWDLYLWLNQLQREVLLNTPEYVARWSPDRLSRISKLATQIFGSEFAPPWETTLLAAAAPFSTAQLFSSRGEFWTEAQSQLAYYRSDRVQNLFFSVGTSSNYFRFDPISSPEKVVIQRIAFHVADKLNGTKFEGPLTHGIPVVPLSDTEVKFDSRGLLIHAPSGDPQLTFARSDLRMPDSAGWLEIEIAPAPAELAPGTRFYFDEARWMDQPSAFGLRLAGWCVLPGSAKISSVEAYGGSRLLASSAMFDRTDVAQEFPQHPHAIRSGFVLELPMLPIESEIVLIARTDDGGRQTFLSALAGSFPNFAPALGPYRTWVQLYDQDPTAPSQVPARGVLFSILLPVYNTPPRFLRECIESVFRQHYPHWELCIVDDASTAADVAPLLNEFARRDARVRIQHRSANGGIGRTTNDALASASGEYVVFLDHDDLLRPHALQVFAEEIGKEENIDALYSDEDKITESGERLVPFLKPAFSPEFLLHVMYVGHALCVRTRAARACGGIDPIYDGVQDYEFFLRLTEHTNRIRHVPQILYHWRQSAGSSALHGNVKGDMDQRQRAAVEAHLCRRYSKRAVTSLGRHRLRITAGESLQAPRVALILAWPIHLNRSDCDWSTLLRGATEVHVLEGTPLPPNFIPSRWISWNDTRAMVRQVAADTTADVVLLVTNPPLNLSSGWLGELAALAARSDSGCVGPLLLSRENAVLESGWTFAGGGAMPLMRGFDPSGDGYNGSLVANREVGCVSPTCIAMGREVAAQLPIVGASWVDACRSIASTGRFNRICIAATMRVIDSWRWSSCEASVTSPDATDPFYNSNFRSQPADYRLAFPPPHPTTRGGGFVSEIETRPSAILVDGCLTLRGWSFRPDRQPVTVEVVVGGIRWAMGCHQPRSDVAAIYPGLTDEGCGYTLHLRLCSGKHHLALRALAPDGSFDLLLEQTLVVPRTAALRRWLHPNIGNRAAFQMMAAPSTTASPVEKERFPKRSLATAAWPRITVVTPSYQQARFLRETMDSVLLQADVKLDYIVQDGGSQDGSVEIIQSYAPRLRAWAHARDRGQADAVALGFAKSDGAPADVMAWLNSDDFYLPGTLAYISDYFAAHPEVDVVYGNRVVVDAESREIGRWFLPAHDPEILKLNDYVPQETLFWRRRIWDKVGGVDISHQFALDWDLLLRFQAAQAKIVHVPYFLACFRVHPTQKTSAAIHTLGREEIDRLRFRALGRELTPKELERDPRLLKYIKRSAEIEFLWRHLHLRCH